MTKTEKNNAKFDKMTPAQKRVAMAQDALKWIEAGALIPMKGLYVNTLSMDIYHRADDLDAVNADGSRKQARDVVLGPCNVCAKGALLIAKAVRFNNVTVLDLANYSDEQLTDYFTTSQISQMEVAFERYDTWWYDEYPDNKERLTAILKNVVRNKGQFEFDDGRPPQ